MINLISITRLKICGINTDACVYDTVKDFSMHQLRRDYVLNKQIAIDYVSNRKAQPRAWKHVQSFDVENIEVLSHACGADFDAHAGAIRKIRRIGYNTLVICNKY